MHRFRNDGRSQRLRDTETSSGETEVAAPTELGWTERMKHFTWVRLLSQHEVVKTKD
jgi:hypothetical protein